MAVRNSALVVIAGLALTLPAVAQDKGPAPQPLAPVPADQAPQDAPRISIDADSHDFGAIPDDKPVTHKIVFRNTGNSVLRIGTLQGSCGCTVPALEKKDYAPGESGEITVTYSPTGRRGKQHTTVTINSNDPVHPSQQVHIHSDVKPLMYVDPQNINFGQAPRGKPLSTTINIYSRNPDLTPIQATASNPSISAKLLDRSETVVDGDTLYLTPMQVSIAPDAEIGQILGTVNIRTSDPARFVSMSVNADIIGDYAVAPMRMQFLNAQPSAPINGTARVTSRSGRPFNITSIEEVGQNGKLFSHITFNQLAETTTQTWNIMVSGSAPSTSTGFRGELIVSTDSPDEPTFKIPYNGYVAAQPSPQSRFNNPTGAPPVDPWVANPSSLIPSR